MSLQSMAFGFMAMVDILGGYGCLFGKAGKVGDPKCNLATQSSARDSKLGC